MAKRTARSSTGQTGRQLAQAEWQKLWERTRRNARPPDVFGGDADGRRVAEILRHLFVLTRDPIFQHAALALEAHGLGGGQPKRSVSRFWEQHDAAQACAPLYMWGILQEAAAKGGALSERHAAERTVAELGLPGQSFAAACDNLRKRFREDRRGKRARSAWADTGLRLFVTAANPAVAAKLALPPEGLEVADDEFWRWQFYAGHVAIRVLGQNRPPKKSQT